MKKNNWILILTVIIIAFILFFVNQIFEKKGTMVEVYVDGIMYASYPLDEPVDVVLQGFQGGTNQLRIRGGKVEITQADCPDELCVKQAAIYRNGESIICLPHRVVVQVVGESEKKESVKESIDAVAN